MSLRSSASMSLSSAATCGLALLRDLEKSPAKGQGMTDELSYA